MKYLGFTYLVKKNKPASDLIPLERIDYTPELLNTHIRQCLNMKLYSFCPEKTFSFLHNLTLRYVRVLYSAAHLIEHCCDNADHGGYLAGKYLSAFMHFAECSDL